MTARRSASFVVFALAAIAASAAVDAQPAGKVRHIGFIAGGSASTGRTLVDAFRVGLRDHGWIEGTNIVVDYRFADGHFDRLPGLADELVRRKVELIVAVPTPTAVAAKSATGSIPVVMASVTDPVKIGLVASLARRAATSPASAIPATSGSRSSRSSRRHCRRPGAWRCSRIRATRAIRPA
ncbi:MAG TPA: ABC transporter substrate binding protein [Casimicrobiaceae bacterium]|nr:ABC transporter substrate binding protein [Casimicrobiaceae bacterium]